MLELLRGARDRRDLERQARRYDALPRVSDTLPLAVTMAEDINRLRDWAKRRTRPAS